MYELKISMLSKSLSSQVIINKILKWLYLRHFISFLFSTQIRYGGQPNWERFTEKGWRGVCEGGLTYTMTIIYFLSWLCLIVNDGSTQQSSVPCRGVKWVTLHTNPKSNWLFRYLRKLKCTIEILHNYPR